MKKIILLTFLFLSASCFSQNNDSDTKNMYALAIENHLKQVEEYIKDGILTYNIEDIYFISEYVQRENLPEFIGNYRVNYLNIYDRENTRLLKKGVRAISVQPISIVKNKIEIYLIDFNIKLKNQEYKYSNGGGSTSTFEFSCDSNKWELKGIKF